MHGRQGSDLRDEGELLDQVAPLLADGKIVGWFQGRMEFGPRSWVREYFGDLRSPTMQAINESEDQVPGKFPSIRSGRSPGTGARMV